MYDCVVVGAGISGLSVACGVHQRGATVLLIEEQPRVGGALWSEVTDDGFVLEHGTQTVSSNDVALWNAFEQFHIFSERVVSHTQRVYLPHQNILIPLSLSPLALAGSKLLSTKAKLRLLFEPFLPPIRSNDESVANFFRRRLGPEFTRSLIEPFVTGVYGGDPSALSVRAMFPMLWESEQQYGSLVRGLVMKGLSSDGRSYRRRETFSFRQGLETWPNAMVKTLPSNQVWLNSSVQRVQPTQQSWEVTVIRNGQEEVIRTLRLVLAVPAYVAAQLLDNLEPSALESLKSTFYPPIAIVHLGYQRSDIKHCLDGMGVLYPAQEQYSALGTLWMSTIFAGYAPAGKVLTTTFVGGALAPEHALQSDEKLIKTISAEQKQLLGIQGTPVLVRVTRWSRSVPQYDSGHDNRIKSYNRLEARWPGLYLASNYRYGFGVEKCWKKGWELANSIVFAKKKS